METLTAIRTRRSVREYASGDVPDAVVDTVLAAGMQAPSAGNERPWHFVVVRDPALREAIAQAHPYAQMMHASPVVIAVCADLRVVRYQGFWAQDCSAATAHILLAAHDQGLGSVWVGVYPEEDRVRALRALLALPESVVPFSLVPLGVPLVQSPEEDRFDQARVHRERWS